MKNTYTFGRKPAQRNYTIDDLCFPYPEQSTKMHAGEEGKLFEQLDRL
jgi:hypothetical protein